MSDAENCPKILGRVLASIQFIANEMEDDLDSEGPWSKDAWIRAYASRANYLRRVVKWAEDGTPDEEEAVTNSAHSS